MADADPIATALKAERIRRGWTLQHVAEKIGRSSYQTIWQWESGSNQPTLPNLREWAAALDKTLTLNDLEEAR